MLLHKFLIQEQIHFKLSLKIILIWFKYVLDFLFRSNKTKSNFPFKQVIILSSEYGDF